MKIEKSESGEQYVQAEIPYKAIVFHKSKEKYIGVLIMEAIVFSKGEEVSRIKKNIEIKITGEELKKLPDTYKVNELIELKPGKYTIKLKITDKTTGKGIYRLIKIEI